MEPAFPPELFAGIEDYLNPSNQRLHLPPGSPGLSTLEAPTISSTVPDSEHSSHSPSQPVALSSESSTPQSPASSGSESGPDPSAVQELLHLIDWQNHQRVVPKRTRGTRDKSHEKHVAHERARRDELAQTIEEIDGIVPRPAASAEAKQRTRLATLQDAKEYLKRVQDVALLLVSENRRLAASIQAHGSPSSADESAAKRPRHLLEGQEVLRLFFITSFLAWVVFGVPTPWTSEISSVSFSTRHVLSSLPESAPPLFAAFLSFACATTLKIAIALGAFTLLWIFTLLQDMPRVSSEQLHTAEEQLKGALAAAQQLSDRRLAHTKCLEALSTLGKGTPTSMIGRVLFLFAQVVRLLLNMMRIGLWLERLLVFLTGRQDITLLEGRIYALHAMTVEHDLHFLGCALAATNSLNVANAPSALKDELALRLSVIGAQSSPAMSMRLLRSALTALAEAQLSPVKLKPSPEEVSDYSLYRMLSHQDSIEDAVDHVLNLLPLLKGPALFSAISAAGIGSFALRRYRDSFVLLSTATRLFRSGGHACYLGALRIFTSLMVASLIRLGDRKEAEQLMRPLESLYMTVPDGKVNLMPAERLFFICTKAIAANDDYSALVAHVREMLSMVPVTSIERFTEMPFLFEMIVESLLSALQLAKDAAHRPRSDLNEAFVIHQRAEIADMTQKVIEVISNGRSFMIPVTERLRGWFASVNNNPSAASYHLNRSLLEARRLDSPAQEEATLAVMASLHVTVLGAEIFAKEKASGDITERLTALFGSCAPHSAMVGKEESV